MKATGVNPESKIAEIMESPSTLTLWLTASSEYASTVLNPPPLFVSFVELLSSMRSTKHPTPRASAASSNA